MIVHTDHVAIKNLMSKKDEKPRLIKWVLLLHEFDLEIKDKKGNDNLIANHLSRLEKPMEDERGMRLKKISLMSFFFKYKFKQHGMLIL